MKKSMKVGSAAVLAAVALVVAAVLALRYGGVTHGDIYDAVIRESAVVKGAVDERYKALDRRLDGIEAKIDRLLEIATRPLPDGMGVAR